VSDRSKQLFEWVWRMNGLLLLGGMVAGLMGVVAVAVDIAGFARRERAERQLTQVAGTDLRAQNLRLADFREIAGTRFLYAQLATPSAYITAGSSDVFGLGDR
jgi:hypothetical protein